MPRTCRQAEELAANSLRGCDHPRSRGWYRCHRGQRGGVAIDLHPYGAGCPRFGRLTPGAFAHPIPRRFPLFDPACLPASVLHRLAGAGYWTFPAELRQRLDRWTELDELESDAAERQLDLMGSVLAR
jgi:hypothetical protein